MQLLLRERHDQVYRIPTVSFLLRSIKALQPLKTYVSHYTKKVSPHRKSVSSGTSCDTYHAQGHHKRHAFCKITRVNGGAVGWGTAQTRKFAGSIPLGVTGIFHWIWSWGRLSLQQKWAPRISRGGKGGRCVGLTNLPPSCTDCLELVAASTSWKNNGLSRPA